MEKKKQRPYSEYEKQLLLQLVQDNINILENRKTDGVSQKTKNNTWDKITKEYNQSNVTQTADTKQLKKMWQNLKSKARDAKTIEGQRKRTGGGPEPPVMGPLESQTIAALPNIMPSIDIPIDSDTPATAGVGDNDEESWLPKRARVSEIEIEMIDDTSVEPPTVEADFCDNVLPQAPPHKKTFEELKKDLLIQEMENNKNKFITEMQSLKEKRDLEIEFFKEKRNMEMEFFKEKRDMEIEFLKEKYKIELEILKLQKERLIKK